MNNRRLFVFPLITVVLAAMLFSNVQLGRALNPPALQTFYLPLSEDNMLQWLVDNYGAAPLSPMRSITAVAIGTNNTHVYYDQWEDGGYDADIANPGANVYHAVTNPAGTQIWGDGVLANGCPPALNNQPNPCHVPTDDRLQRGEVITLDNWVIINGASGSYSRNPAQIFYDGRDKIGVTLPTAVTRALWPSGAGSLVADAQGIMPTELWGTAYISPVGENIAVTGQSYQDVRLLIIAGEGGATIDVDANADGDANDANDHNDYAMLEGDRLLVDGVNAGATVDVVGGNPVQVSLLTADTGSTYENRFYALIPSSNWTSEYYTPVGTPAGSTACTNVWIFNPNPTSINVNYTLGNGNTGTINNIPSKVAVGSPDIPDGYGARFYNANGQVFLPVSMTDCSNSTSGDIYDWGTELYPIDQLSPEILVGWAPGCTNESDIGMCREEDGSPANRYSRSVVWVTPLTNTTLYVDTDGSGINCSAVPSPSGAEQVIPVNALQAARIDDDPTTINNVRHEFATANYTTNGPNNTQNWATAWTETGETTSPTGGAIRINTTADVLRFQDSGGVDEAERSIQRTANLSGQVFARFSFRLQSAGTIAADDRLAVDVSADGGASWSNLAVYNSAVATQRVEVFNISNFIASTTTIRFRFVDGVEAGETWSIDNVNIQYTPAGDFDMTGAYIRTCDDTRIAAAFGQNPGYSGNSDNEAMDLGMGVPPYGSSITLKKVADRSYVAPGDLVTYTYEVKLRLTYSTVVNNVEVDDDRCSPVVYQSGDGGNPGYLDPGEVWTFTCSTRLYAETTNTALAYAFYGPDRIRSSPDQATVKLASSLGDFVWVDEDGDGDQDAGEPGISNVRVTLVGTDLDGNPVNLTTYTDINGRYVFSAVPPGDAAGYTISVDPGSLPTGLAANPTYDEDGTSTAHTTSVLLGSDLEYMTADFGYNWASVTDTNSNSGAGMIGDRVWSDADGDGRQDPGEPGLFGVTVELLTAGVDGLFGTTDDVLAGSTTSGYDGSYAFDGLPTGAYAVRIPGVPAGYSQTGDPDQPGFQCTICDGRTTAPILLSPGDVYLNADFGLQPDVATAAVIGDTLWVDADHDNLPGAGEPRLAGVSVSLIRDLNANGQWDAGEPIIATDITDGSGAYAFTGVPVGDGDGTDDYLIWVNDAANVLYELAATYDFDGADPAAGVASGLGISAASDLTPAGDDQQDFAYAPKGHDSGEGFIGDTLWYDWNGSTNFDLGEGLEGVLVSLLDATGSVVAQARTNELGRYFFGGLAVGDYTVEVETTTLPNYGVGLANFVDPDGGGDSVANVTIGGSYPLANLDQDFGYTTAAAPNSVGGTIWNDANADGAQDTGETRLFAGVSVALYTDSNDNGVWDAGDMLVGTTATDGTGNYAFYNLPDDTYFVDVTDEDHTLNGAWHTLGAQAESDDGQSKADFYTINLSGGEARTTVDFGYYTDPAEIGNLAWLDRNGDGVQDTGEPGIQGVEVTLTVTYPDASVVTVKTLSGLGGAYSFANLLLDEDFDGAGGGEPVYVVSAAIPPGMTASPENEPGVGDQIDGDSDGADETASVVQGEIDTSYDFGFSGGTDLGDLPDGIGGLSSYPTLFAAGAAHVVYPDGVDPDSNPDTTGGIPAVWLGASLDTDLDGQPTAMATGDGNDEDALQLASSGWVANGSSAATITLNSSEDGANVYYALWIDWGDDSSFDDADDGFYAGSQVVSGPTQVMVSVSVPASYAGNTPVYLRLRAYTAPLQRSDSAGTLINGEVEDYRAAFYPTAIRLTRLNARAGSDSLPLLLLFAALMLTGVSTVRRRR